MSWVRDSNRDRAGHRGYSMACDHPGCDATCGHLDDPQGWVRQKTGITGFWTHWCPNHRPEETA